MANWSELENDVLGLITSKLELPDYLHFGAACKNWQFIAKAKCYSPAQQLPWLILEEDKTPRRGCSSACLNENVTTSTFLNYMDIFAGALHMVGFSQSIRSWMDIFKTRLLRSTSNYHLFRSIVRLLLTQN